MPAQETRRRLRTVFDLDAEAYERTRPVCPAPLFDDLVRLAGLRPGARVLEIGCGTGQATLPLVELGLAVDAVELGGALAERARARLARYPNARVVTGAFEDWEPDGPKFDAVVACNALHWVDPELRYAKPAALLRPGGVLAVISCQWARPTAADRFWFDVQADYLAVGYEGEPPPPPEAIRARQLPPKAEPFFENVASRRYPFRRRYSADDYLAILATQSGTRQLGQARAADFLGRVRRRLAGLGSPELTATFVALLTLGRAR